MKQKLMIVLGVLAAAGALAVVEYTEIEYTQLKVAPEDYRHKHVAYTGIFQNLSATFLPYMEKSGFKPEKYLWLVVGDLQVPAIAKKTDAMTAFAAGLKKGTTVKVYGKVKEFRSEPKQTVHPHYYVEVETVEELEEPKPGRLKPPARFKPKLRRALP
jgi:hypothetical protein